MKPITRDEMYLATAAGEYSGELPEPVTRSEYYWQKSAQRIDDGSSVSPEAMDAAIENFLNTHDADVVTEAKLSDALSGKADVSHTHAKSQITDLADASASSGGVGGAAGLMSAADKEKLDAVNAGTRVLLRSGTAVNLLNETNQELDLGENVDLLNYTAIEIRELSPSNARPTRSRPTPSSRWCTIRLSDCALTSASATAKRSCSGSGTRQRH